MEKIPVFSIIILHHEPIKHHHHPRPAQKIATFSPVASLHQRPQRWLCRTIQLRRRLVACHPGDDCHTSTKKCSRSIKTQVNKKHLKSRWWWVEHPATVDIRPSSIRRWPDMMIPSTFLTSSGEEHGRWYVGMVSVGTTSNRVVSKG